MEIQIKADAILTNLQITKTKTRKKTLYNYLHRTQFRHMKKKLPDVRGGVGLGLITFVLAFLVSCLGLLSWSCLALALFLTWSCLGCLALVLVLSWACLSLVLVSCLGLVLVLSWSCLGLVLVLSWSWSCLALALALVFDLVLVYFG
jgi:hypothetical protein